MCVDRSRFITGSEALDKIASFFTINSSLVLKFAIQEFVKYKYKTSQIDMVEKRGAFVNLHSPQIAGPAPCHVPGYCDSLFLFITIAS